MPSRYQEEPVGFDLDALETFFDTVQIGLLLIFQKAMVSRINHVTVRMTGKEPAEMQYLRPGDALGCINAVNTLAGCGHSAACEGCLQRSMVKKVISSGQKVHGVEFAHSLSIIGDKGEFTLTS